MRYLQDANDLDLFQMDQQGFDRKMFRARLEVVPETAPITIKHSQARAEVLAKAKTHGSKFTVKGGGHVTSNGGFKDMEMSTREKDIKNIEDDKKACKKLMKVEKEIYQSVGLCPFPIRATKSGQLGQYPSLTPKYSD